VDLSCQHLLLSPEDHSEELQSKTNGKSYVQPQEYSCQTGPHPNNLEDNNITPTTEIREMPLDGSLKGDLFGMLSMEV